MDYSSHQEYRLSNSLESMVVCQKTLQERKPRPQPEQALRCPRCDSINTKFCYYNNYSLTQPRYFCKSCRRYWTKGGTLRNIPVGGGCRKNKNSPPPSSSSSFKRYLNDQTFAPGPTMAAYYDSSDLSLAFEQPRYSDSFNLISGFENQGFSDTLRDGVLESYLSSCQNLQSGFENGGLKLPCDHHEVGNLTTSAVTVTAKKDEILWESYQNWNGISSSLPHGLLYSHLM